MSDQGVVISPKEMYDLLRNIEKNLQEIKSDIRFLKEKADVADQADKRSRKALEKAEEALKLAEKVENHQTWLWRAIMGSLIAGAIGILFYFARGG